MVKQCKGKDLSKVPSSRLDTGLYLASIKYDGHYVQIHKTGNSVRFFTSGGKEFYHELSAEELLKVPSQHNYILECEYIADTDGKLGNRGKAAKLTTYRTNFEKGIANIGLNSVNDTFKVFDTIIEGMTFEDRLHWMKETIKFGDIVQLANFDKLTLEDSKKMAKVIVKDGFEGLFIKTLGHLYLEGKRVNNAIKLKYRPTADLLCIGINEGEGKYEGMIGSLILMDSKNRLVNVGAGLDDFDRAKSETYFIGKVIEIEYEQIQDTYIQPTFKTIRLDKPKEEID